MTPLRMTQPRRKQDILMTLGLWAMAVLFGWFAYEAREIRAAVYQGQRDQAALTARVDGMEGRVSRIEARVDGFHSGK
jgi:cell division protein FtsB